MSTADPPKYNFGIIFAQEVISRLVNIGTFEAANADELKLFHATDESEDDDVQAWNIASAYHHVQHNPVGINLFRTALVTIGLTILRNVKEVLGFKTKNRKRITESDIKTAIKMLAEKKKAADCIVDESHVVRSEAKARNKTTMDSIFKPGVTAFVLFSNQKRPQIQKEHPKYKRAEINAALTKQWKKLSAEEKAPYESKANETREDANIMNTADAFPRPIPANFGGGKSTNPPKNQNHDDNMQVEEKKEEVDKAHRPQTRSQNSKTAVALAAVLAAAPVAEGSKKRKAEAEPEEDEEQEGDEDEQEEDEENGEEEGEEEQEEAEEVEKADS